MPGAGRSAIFPVFPGTQTFFRLFQAAMSLFLSALGLMMVFEGVPYFCFPSKVKQFAQQLPLLKDGSLRAIGLVLILSGLLISYFGRNLT